ncbi:MAG: hypothetical protein M1825_003878 [Sarcosagium campestre]|nr:MAG: hypothetical protein M1825_003878 [Sarcosagium campestre]
MPVVDPAALSRTGTGQSSSTSAVTASKTVSGSGGATQKASKGASMGQRIDLEPVFTILKASVGEEWATYKEAISLYVLGQLSHAEVAARIDHFIGTDPSKEHMHNQLLSAIYGNVTRDLPDNGVAAWVTSMDKPATPVKPVSGDAIEQRLRAEVMQLPARDRRRVKDIPDVDPFDTYSQMLADSRVAKSIRPPDIGPVSAGGNTTNWDLEIRKRYATSLSSETYEFPDTHSIGTRILPSCYEEGLMQGAAPACAAFLATATETFVKQVLSTVLGRTRSNGNGYISTGAYKKQLKREEASWLRGEINKSGTEGLLPVEATAMAGRRPLGVDDLRFALNLGGDAALGSMPLIVARVFSSWSKDPDVEESRREQLDVKAERRDDHSNSGLSNSGLGSVSVAAATGVTPAAGLSAATPTRVLMTPPAKGAVAGSRPSLASMSSSALMPPPPSSDPNAMDIDPDWGGWEGGGPEDQEALKSLMDECLLIGGA